MPYGYNPLLMAISLRSVASIARVSLPDVPCLPNRCFSAGNLIGLNLQFLGEDLLESSPSSLSGRALVAISAPFSVTGGAGVWHLAVQSDGRAATGERRPLGTRFPTSALLLITSLFWGERILLGCMCFIWGFVTPESWKWEEEATPKQHDSRRI